MTEEYKILDDGSDKIYFGRILKNGCMGKDTHELTEEEMITVAYKYLSNYCKKNDTNFVIVNVKKKKAFKMVLLDSDCCE
jgi:hypothetical protein